LLTKPCMIGARDTAQILHDKLAISGAQAIIEALSKLDQGSLAGMAQDASQATYAAKLVKSEAELDWEQSAAKLERAIRAYNPVPGAYSSLNGTTIKIWQAKLVEAEQCEAGTVIAVDKHGIQVACGQGTLCLEELQRPNGKALPASQFVQGFMIKAGDRFNTQ
jgi:methionyl-tRNA formyltransferase